MKAIILTDIELSKKDKKFLQETDIFKMALNQHAEELKPDCRIITDYQNFEAIYKNFPEPLVSVRYYPRENYLRLIKGNVDFRGSTIVAGCEWLYKNNYKDILIIGDNTVHGKEHQETVKKGIKQILELYPDIKIHQFKNGNFDLEQKGIENFIKVVYRVR